MLLLLSPAKSLDYTTPVPATVARLATEPAHAARAAELIGVLRKRSAAQVGALMGISPALAQLNVERYAAWRPQPAPEHVKPAILAFDGDVYGGLDAKSLTPADLRWAQDHLVLLSGLYGVLRPLDLLQPYRLEMGTALATRHGRDLYAFWDDTVAEHLNAQQADDPRPVVVNLASQEYARVALRPALNARVVDCVFEDWKDGRYKIISFYAKRARGLMARHAVRRRAATPRALLSFDTEGYTHDRGASQPDRLVFRRRA